MEHLDQTPQDFNKLLRQLLDAVGERRNLKLDGATMIELIENNDRLHTIRAELAVARHQLDGDGSKGGGESGTNGRSPQPATSDLIARHAA